MFRVLAQTLALALALCTPTVTLAQDGDPITEFATNDAAMNAAQQTAQDTLPLFLANATDVEGFGVISAAVKVAFDIGNNQTEVIWVGPFAWDGDQGMIGLLSNQPNFMGDLNAGDQVEFSVGMVRDWSVASPEGQIFGNYTTRVMLPMLDADTAAPLSAALANPPIPTDWK